MSSLSRCLQEAGGLVSQEARAEIMRRADALRKEGVAHAEASKKAVAEYATEHAGKLKEVETAFNEGATLYETVPDTPAAAAEAEAAVSRVDQVLSSRPDLAVQLDGMDAPVSAAEYLKTVRAEADEMAADSPLMLVAAECALLHP